MWPFRPKPTRTEKLTRVAAAVRSRILEVRATFAYDHAVGAEDRHQAEHDRVTAIKDTPSGPPDEGDEARAARVREQMGRCYEGPRD